MIDIKKIYTTRSGLPVRIYAVDAMGNSPIHGAVQEEGKAWDVLSWMSSGAYAAGDPNQFDLIEVKPKRMLDVWINIYSEGPGRFATSKEEADHCAAVSYPHGHRLACLHIVREFTEGEGLQP